jgi:flagellar basal-body rod protein FlgG
VPTGVQLGLGVKTAAVYRITTQGSLLSTDNTLDLALEGDGYFQIEMPSGETGYTRDGSFQLSADGEVVTHDGYRVAGLSAIPTTATTITVNTSGEVLYKLDGTTAMQSAGQLSTAIFPNEAGLNAIGDNYFLETAASGAPSTATPGSSGYGTVLQGFLETSNVNVVSEITDLISAQRAYEMNSKVISTSDEMMSTVSRLKS